ncbi:MAG: hypothetical protein SH847_00345, partial [Roseiflexaceae bacterium]|nr:hypothetical protein [Roseiflexaceae bacterium]
VSDSDSAGKPVSQVDTYEIVYCLKFTVSRLYPIFDQRPVYVRVNRVSSEGEATIRVHMRPFPK